MRRLFPEISVSKGILTAPVQLKAAAGRLYGEANLALSLSLKNFFKKCNPSIHTMDQPDIPVTVSNFMKKIYWR